MNLDTLKTSTVETDACQVAYERAWGGSVDEDDDQDDAASVHGLGIAELDFRDWVAVRACWPGTGAEQATLLREHGVAEPGGPAPKQEGVFGSPADWRAAGEQPTEPPETEIELDLSDVDLMNEPAAEDKKADEGPDWDSMLG